MLYTIIDKTRGNIYKYDTETNRTFCNDVFISDSYIEPVYSGNTAENIPLVAGLWIKTENYILTINGNSKTIVDPNQIL